LSLFAITFASARLGNVRITSLLTNRATKDSFFDGTILT
jgi:hypothetical protein